MTVVTDDYFDSHGESGESIGDRLRRTLISGVGQAGLPAAR
jgi:hypothetical protein